MAADGVQHFRHYNLKMWWLTGTALGFLGGIAVTTTATLGLLVISVLLVLAALLRWLPLMLPIAVSATVPLLLWTIALIRCEPSLGRACTLDDGQLALVAWDSLVLTSAIGGTLILRRLEGRHSGR